MSETKYKSRKIVITSALPYANGSIHLGHLVEYIQSDIWRRFQLMRGNECLYFCADDSHGTPIMLKAQDEEITPEELIAKISKEHQQDFADFNIEFDFYHSTHSDENRELAEMIYTSLHNAGHISKRTIAQAYDPEKEMFLPDRFIKGECPRCGADDQYGDNCEACGATYSPTELKNARSVVSGAKPESRDSEHYFFKLSDFEEMLKEWTTSGHLQSEVSSKLGEWFEAGLQEWDISRDKPYFGFKIPQVGDDKPEDKYFYVWLDAPIGYIASCKKYCSENSLDWKDVWGEDSDVELYHFIGKDITYFHALFWPAMLQGAGLRKPDSIFVHGFLTVNGQKMSKSRGTFIKARDYLDNLDAEYLRYYFAAKLGSNIGDIDLNLEDFRQRVNSDLVGKLVNIASRCAGFITKKFAGELAELTKDNELLSKFSAVSDKVAQHYEQREYAHAMREIMQLADVANQYVDEQKPWVLAKEEGKETEVQQIATMGINMFRILVIYLKPVLPELAQKAEQFLNIEPLQWNDAQSLLIKHKINKFKPLMQRVEEEQVVTL